MPHDDSTWVIHSLPRAADEASRPSPPAPRLAFQSVLSPWRKQVPSRDSLGEGESVQGRPRRTAG
jgi:hypothetical protein